MATRREGGGRGLRHRDGSADIGGTELCHPRKGTGGHKPEPNTAVPPGCPPQRPVPLSLGPPQLTAGQHQHRPAQGSRGWVEASGPHLPLFPGRHPTELHGGERSPPRGRWFVDGTHSPPSGLPGNTSCVRPHQTSPLPSMGNAPAPPAHKWPPLCRGSPRGVDKGQHGPTCVPSGERPPLLHRAQNHMWWLQSPAQPPQSPAQPPLLCGWRQSPAAGGAANKGKQPGGRRGPGQAEAAPIHASWNRSKRSITSELKISWKYSRFPQVLQ